MNFDVERGVPQTRSTVAKLTFSKMLEHLNNECLENISTTRKFEKALPNPSLDKANFLPTRNSNNFLIISQMGDMS